MPWSRAGISATSCRAGRVLARSIPLLIREFALMADALFRSAIRIASDGFPELLNLPHCTHGRELLVLVN